MKPRRIGLGLLLAMACGAGIWLAAHRLPIAAGSASATQGGTRAERHRSTEERVAMVANGIRAIEDGERQAARDRWDPAYVVEKVGSNADSLRLWVSGNTAWIPYQGALRGPVGVLMDRQGNSLDRATLLATLLEQAGHTVRLKHGQLSARQADSLLPALTAVEAGPVDTPELDAVEEMDELAQEYALDVASITQVADSHATSIQRMAGALQERVADHTIRLSATLERANPSDEWDLRYDRAVRALRDHWWVEVQAGEEWRQLEILPIAPPPADRTVSLQTLPDSEHHRLTVRVIAEIRGSGELVEKSVLEHTFRPSATIGKSIVLQIWPAAWPKELHSDPDSPLGVRGQALAQTEWAAVLLIGSEAAASGVLTALSSNGSQPLAPSGNPFGGLGGAIASATASAKAEHDLTAAWIEYELAVPNQAPRRYRRALFDLIGPASRRDGAIGAAPLDEQARLRRSLALMFRADILPVVSRIAPEFALHLGSRSVLTNQSLLRAVAGSDSDSQLVPDSLLAQVREVVSPLYPLAFARLEWGRHAGRLYLNEVNLLTRHRHVGVANDSLTMRGSVEILARDVGVSLAEPNAVAVRFEQGILDTNAEALWWSGEGINSTADAFSEAGEWVTLTREDAGVLDRMPMPHEAHVHIREDLAAGLTVVMPRQSVRRGPDEFIGWWRVDPTSGRTSGTPGNGWAQCGSEYALHIGVIAQFAEGFAFEYAMCHGLLQAMNAFKYAVSELRSRGYSLYAGPIEVGDPVALAAMNEKSCVIGAMFAGVLSTIPFFLEVRMARRTGIPSGARVNPFARTEPGVNPPSPPRPQVKSQPNTPQVKTQPMRPQVKTQPDLGPKPPIPEAPPRAPRPATLEKAREELAQAKAAQEAAEAANHEATREWVQYRANKPRPAKGWEGNPSEWHPDVDAELTAKQAEATRRNIEAINRVNEAKLHERELTIAARRAAGRSGLASAIGVGSAGIADALQSGGSE